MKDHSKPTISIITATYNAMEHLRVLIESLVAQTDQDFEWVVADGGSTDGTLELLEKAKEQLKYVVVDSRSDFGIYDALNRAIKKATGEYYLVLGADDVIDPHAMFNFKNLGAQTQADILTTAIYCSGRDGLLLRPGGQPWLHGGMAYVTGHAVGAVFRKSLHDRKSVGFYSNKYPICADQLFIKNAIQSGASVAVGNFLSGTFGSNGVSSINTGRVLSEFFLVQLETERWKGLQVILFILRLIKNFPRLLRKNHRANNL